MSSSRQAIEWFSFHAEDSATKFLRNTGDGSFIHTIITHLGPPPLSVLDVGAGSGDIAAVLAERGHVVTAVEPCKTLRQIGEKRYTSLPLCWIEDRLPSLITLSSRKEKFDLVLAYAVLMFMDEPERMESYKRLNRMGRKDGLIAILNKYNQMEPERGAYLIPPNEVSSVAANLGWKLIFSGELSSPHGNESDLWMGYIFRL